VTGRYVLPGGLTCELLSPHMPGVPGYHVLAARDHASAAAVDEMARLAAGIARELGRRRLGDEGAFTIILNGARTRRRQWAHVHIIPADTPARKRRAFAFLCLKGPLRRLERGLRGPRRQPHLTGPAVSTCDPSGRPSTR
jgi:hypothetical protein